METRQAVLKEMVSILRVLTVFVQRKDDISLDINCASYDTNISNFDSIN